MSVFHHQTVQRSRRIRQCTWCGEPIEIGQPYQSYRWTDGGDAGTVVLHPECSDAMARLSAADPQFYGWTHGEFSRGSAKVR